MSNAKPNLTPLQRIISRILQWARRSLGLQQPRQPGTLEGACDRATLWRVPSEDPGVVTSWWICHRDASADLVISLINLAQLREDIGRGQVYRRTADPIRITGQRSFSAELDTYFESQGGLDASFVSHIFVVAWRSRIPSGAHRRYLVRPAAAIPCDLQGVTNAWTGGDRYALKIIEVIARRLLRTQAKLNTWQEIIEHIDWLEWLDYYAKHALGDTHVLQPRRR